MDDFTLIHQNIYLHTTTNAINDDISSKCQCSRKSNSNTPTCVADAKCINVATRTECVATQCGSMCQNQRIQKKDNLPPLKLYKTHNKGWGVKAEQQIMKHSLVCEYVGEVIDSKMRRKRLKKNALPAYLKENNFYVMDIGKNMFIDATYKGNIARFINHSCDPSCEAQLWMVKGYIRCAIYAIKNIQKNEDITFDYTWKLPDEQILPTICRCGEPKCRLFIEKF
jgi:SET domain-containing protein